MPGYDEEVIVSGGEPQSANLIVNGLCGESPCSRRVRCSSEIVRQLETLAAQDTFSAIVKRESRKEVHAVQEVLSVASTGGEDEGNFQMLVESGNLVETLVRDLEKSFERKI